MIWTSYKLKFKCWLLCQRTFKFVEYFIYKINRHSKTIKWKSKFIYEIYLFIGAIWNGQPKSFAQLRGDSLVAVTSEWFTICCDSIKSFTSGGISSDFTLITVSYNITLKFLGNICYLEISASNKRSCLKLRRKNC